MPSSYRDTSGSSNAVGRSTPHNLQDTPSRPQSSLRREVGSPTSAGSDGETSFNDSTGFAPSLLASRLGRSLYGTTTGIGSTSSLAESGFSTPTLALTGFNAVSTVLNNPSKRQHPIDPKSSRYPAVTPNHVLADIPRPKKGDLEPYLSSVRPEWDRFMRNQSLGRQGKATLAAQQQQEREQQQSFDSEPLGKDARRHRTTPSIASLSADLNAIPPPAAKKRLPLLSAVPQVFFKEDFDLGNPYTFDVVTERYKATTAENEKAGSVTPTYDVALNQMLQEKLSYYSDVVEQHLIIEIGQQSSSFFAALDNLNDLNAEAESCLKKIYHLKAEVETLDQKQAKMGLKVVREQHKRRQIQRSQTAVQDVRQALERCELIRLLHHQGETEEALEMINDLRSLLRLNSSRTDSPGKDKGRDAADRVVLSELQCLTEILPQLDELESSLSDVLEKDLLSMLKDDIGARLQASRASALQTANGYFDNNSKAAQTSTSLSTGGDLSLEPPLTPSKPLPSPFGHASEPLTPHDADLANRIAPYIVGLARTGKIEQAMTAYRELAVQAVRTTWQETLSHVSDPMSRTVDWLLAEDLSKYDDHSDLPAPAAYLRDLDHAAFLSIGHSLFDSLIACLKAIDSQAKLIPRILDQHNLETAKTERSDQNELMSRRNTQNGWQNDNDTLSLPAAPIMPAGVSPGLPTKMAEVVVAATEQAHTLCARVLALRTMPHIAMDLSSFLTVSQLSWSFILTSELISRKMIVGLRGSVLGQAKGFLATFHRKRIEQAAKAVEEETWAQAEVGHDIQSKIRRIVDSAVEDPAEFVITSESLEVPSGGGQEQSTKEDETMEKTLEIEDRQYFVVNASLNVLALLVEYLRVIINLPLLTTEAMARVVEFLKQFNSRTCQVVLGAGAMRSAGLKNITAKHLALASQSLSIMVSLIPYIRETVRRHLSPKQAVMLTEFDKLRRDFQEHQYEIHAKLVAIMSDRLTVHCRTLGNIDWNVESTDNIQGEPNKYAVDLVKETATLHKVLSKYLHVPVVEHIIGQVLQAIDARVGQEFDRVDVKKQSTRDRIVVDVDYLKSKLSTLKNVKWQGNALDTMLESKQAPATPVLVSAPSTPVLEQRPDTPTSERGGSHFPPVSYKPRIPNIFARRQQQQQQGSPRGSMDSVPQLERRGSVEGTPRSSLQQQRTSFETSTSQLVPVQQEERTGARSIQEEVKEDVPPPPPSKTATEEPAVSITEENRMSEDDLVAPILPVPDAVLDILTEEQPSKEDKRTDVEEQTSTDITDPVANVVDAVTEAKEEAVEAGEPATTVSEPIITSAVNDGETAPVSNVETASSDVQADSNLSTPIRVSTTSVAPSGSSAPGTPTSAAGTPSKPGRMTLKERLAEAARKRAMQSAPPASTNPSLPSAEVETAATAAPSKEVQAVDSSPKREAELLIAEATQDQTDDSKALPQEQPKSTSSNLPIEEIASSSPAPPLDEAESRSNEVQPAEEKGSQEVESTEAEPVAEAQTQEEGTVARDAVKGLAISATEESVIAPPQIEEAVFSDSGTVPSDITTAVNNDVEAKTEEVTSHDTTTTEMEDDHEDRQDNDDDPKTPNGDAIAAGTGNVPKSPAKKKKKKNKKKK